MSEQEPTYNLPPDEAPMAIPPARTPLGAPGAPRKRLGNLAIEQHKTHLNSAKRILIVIGILTLLANGVLFFMIRNNAEKLEQEIASVQANPNMALNQALVAQHRATLLAATLLTGAFAALGIVFIVIAFFVNAYPVGATLTAFILYLLAICIGFAIDPVANAVAIIIRIIIAYYLYKGVKAGMAIQKLRAEEAAAA